MKIATLESILHLEAGNTLIVGAAGTTKTLLVNSLYHTSRIVLDGLTSLHLSQASVHGILASGLAVITVRAITQLGSQSGPLLDRISNFVFFRVSNAEDAQLASALSSLRPDVFLTLPELSAIVCDRSGHIESVKVDP